MIYELRTYTLKPGSADQFEAEFEKGLAVRKKYSPLAGAWHSEIGPLNQFVHLWPYEDLNERARIRAAAAADPSGAWPPHAAELEWEMQSEILIPAPFMRPLDGTPQQLGNVYELRIYTFQTGTIGRVLETWAPMIEKREKYSPLAGCWTSEAGTLNRFFHLWPYKDLNDRERIRTEAVKAGDWPPPTRQWLVRQENKILIPAAFSPLH